VSYLALSDEQRAADRRALRSCAVTLEQAAGHAVPFDVAAAALATGLAEALDLTLVGDGLSEYERTLAADLCRDRYAAPHWTAHS
jgi:predicted N-formylglutamate amidohydrolase